MTQRFAEYIVECRVEPGHPRFQKLQVQIKYCSDKCRTNRWENKSTNNKSQLKNKLVMNGQTDKTAQDHEMMDRNGLCRKLAREFYA